MLSKTDIQQNTNYIKHALKLTKRKGIENLIEYLESTDFFTAPASTKWHGAYEGGLAEHNINVMNMLLEIDVVNPDSKSHSRVIAGLLHDVCKIGCYDGSGRSSVNRLAGHAKLSIVRIAKYIELTPLETLMIQYHMGVYSTVEFNPKYGEYTFKDLIKVWNQHPIVKLMYMADDISTIGNKHGNI